MRIIRFLNEHGEVQIGADRGDGIASVLIDTLSTLGPDEDGTSIIDALRDRHAIVADDDPKMRELMTAVLRKAACRCTVCCDGAEAMKALDDPSVDLIVSDIRMPHHDGFEIFSAARARSKTLPIVLVTGFGYDPTHALVRVAEHGHDRILYKPFTPRQLLEELNKAVADCSGSDATGIVDTGEITTIDTLLAPLQPTNILCVGRNYANAEQTIALRDEPLEVFMKPTTAVQAPDGPIRIPELEDGANPMVDCEGELALIIGTELKNASEDDVMSAVFGFTLADDVTARRFQTPTGPPRFMRGKGFDTFCPIGPAIIPAADMSAPESMTIRTAINGNVVREGHVGKMVRTIPEILSELSRNYTLTRGTVVLTGSPPRPDATPDPCSLQPGDVVTIDAEGLGALTNTVIAASDE
ncbi:MAG: fumarylacetoacetate hydrolase family protein [Planctomycetota bacterium]